MFGKLTIRRRRLDFAAQDAYRAAFCGTCHSLRKFGGRLASLLTNYDVTLLTLVVADATGAPIEASRLGCTAMPLRSVDVTVLDAVAERYVAAITIASVAAKLRDDVVDEGRLRSRIGLGLIGRREQQALAELDALGFPTAVIRELPQRQTARERDASSTLHELAGPSADLLGAAFAHAARLCGSTPNGIWPSDATASIETALREFGTALGRWLYLYDAIDDFDEDRARGRFNAIAHVVGARGAGEFDPQLRASLHAQLTDLLERAARAIARVPRTEARAAVLAGLLQTLRERTDRAVGEPAAVRLRRAEAGECDVGCCDCGSCECGSCDACHIPSCSSARDSTEAGSSCCECCIVCPCCDAWCCFGGRDRAERRRRRRDARDRLPPFQT